MEDELEWGYLRLHIRYKGTPTRDWEVRSASLEDAGGNKLALWEHSYSAGEEEILPLRGHFQQGPDRQGLRDWVLPYCLWLGEAAWKIGVVLGPRPGAEFQSGELYAFTNLLVPASGEVTPVNLKTNVQGSDLDLFALCGKGADPSGEARLFPDTCVLTISPSPSSYSVVVVRTVDDMGRRIEVGPARNFSIETGPGSWRSFEGIPLKIPSDAKSVAVTLGVTTNRLGTFMVRPPRFPVSGMKK